MQGQIHILMTMMLIKYSWAHFYIFIIHFLHIKSCLKVFMMFIFFYDA